MISDKWIKTVNDDGETEFRPVKNLIGRCTVEAFNSSHVSKNFRKGKRSVKIDGRNHRVLLNDDGECSVEQFGTIGQANRRYKRIIEWIRSVK